MATTSNGSLSENPDIVMTLHDSKPNDPIPPEVRLRVAIKILLRGYGFRVSNIKVPHAWFQGAQYNNRNDGLGKV